MTDFEKFQHSYASHRAAGAAANARNKTAVFDALLAAGVTELTVTFDGEGDSGQIEEKMAHAAERLIDLPAAAITMHYAEWNQEALTSREQLLAEAVEELCYGYLWEKHPGWEINDGSYGEFRFDVANRTIEVEFNGRYTDVNTDIHSL